ncbi:MAG: Bug family tripartite tricarboxylate transporter substrate binding protein [Lautropia sp.]
MRSRFSMLMGAAAHGAILAGALLALAMPASAQQWPSRPVKLINPFSAGSAVDVVARTVADQLSKNLDAQFLVDNRTGASGNIGTELAARAAPDGYTFLLGSPGTMAINPALFDKLPYDARKDFVPVVHIVSFPQALVVNASVPAKTVDELVKWVAAQKGNVNYASSGKGSTSHLVMEMIRSEAKLDMTHVPYRGGSLAMQALVGGEVQVAVEGLPSLPGHLAGGKVRALAVTSSTRAKTLPDVPALAETYKDFDAAAWIILFAPTGTPAPIVERMSSEVKRALSAPTVVERLEKMSATAFGADPATTATFHAREMEKFRKAVEISGAKGN